MIRRMKRRDIEAVEALAASAFYENPQQYGRRQIERNLDDSMVVNLVDIDEITDHMRGFIVFEKCVNGPAPWLVCWIAVDESYQRQGVASGLLARVPKPAWAWVWWANEPSRKMFEKNGYSGRPHLAGSKREWWVYEQ